MLATGRGEASIEDRVDLIAVCQITCRHNSSTSSEKWEVEGFQGQLQEAWLRVYSHNGEGDGDWRGRPHDP